MTVNDQEISGKAFDLAKKYEMENGDCAQCVFAAVTEVLGLENKDVFRSATGFADGIGLTGDGHCGALSGGVMSISYIFGRKREEFTRRGKMMKAVLLSKELHTWFKSKHGTCRCHDIQARYHGRSFDLYSADDLAEAVRAGLIETCSTLAGEVARATVELIIAQQNKDAAKTS